MTDSNVLKLNTPDHPLQEVLREGARMILATAIEAEAAAFLKQHGSLKTDEGETGSGQEWLSAGTCHSNEAR